MILVTAATGKVASEAVRLLRQRERAVRALVRHPDKAAALGKLGAEVVEGDLESAASVDKAMQGVDAVFLVTPGMPPLELNVIQAASRAGVKHVVKVSNYNPSAEAKVPWRRWHFQLEGALAGSGLGHTILRPNFYMQNILGFAPRIAQTSSFGAPLGNGRVGMVDARDVAVAAVAVLEAPAAHKGKTYDISGPAALSYADVAATLSKVLRKPIAYRNISFEDNKKGMLAAGLPEPMADAMNEMYRLLSTDVAAVTSGDFQTVVGKRPRTFEQFATEFAKAFS